MTDTSIKTVTLNELWSKWPQISQSELAKALGGEVGELVGKRTDDSPIRLSTAFNDAGHYIPQSTVWSGIEVKDKNERKYIVDNEDFKSLLNSRLGKPIHIKHQSDALRKQGIIYFENIKSLHDTPGHFDLWNGQQLAGIENPWSESGNILLWKLP